MRSSKALLSAFVVLLAATATAQTPVDGFALERLNPTVGSPWIGLDALDSPEGLGGAVSATFGYANRPLVVPGGTAVVSDQALLDYGMMISWNRLRLSVVLSQPLHSNGRDAMVGDSAWTSPHLDIGLHPDTLADARIDLSARVWGTEDGPIRLGLSAQLFVPSGTRDDYLTDGTLRATGKLLAAGRVGPVDWAGSAGVHVRPLDLGDVVGAPHGSEFLWTVAAGVRREVGSAVHLAIGPEFWGFTIFKNGSTGIEGLLSGRIDLQLNPGALARFKVAAGAGLSSAVGVPEWRGVLSFELVGALSAK